MNINLLLHASRIVIKLASKLNHNCDNLTGATIQSRGTFPPINLQNISGIALYKYDLSRESPKCYYPASLKKVYSLFLHVIVQVTGGRGVGNMTLILRFRVVIMASHNEGVSGEIMMQSLFVSRRERLQ